MPRPGRTIWVLRTYARRRHRIWMYSMTLATLGWGTWWLAIFLFRFVPALNPGLGLTSVVSCLFAVLGLGAAMLTVRARRTWLLFALVPLFANGSLLVLPWLAAEFLERTYGTTC